MAGKLKVYEYSGCSTCKKALKFLDAKHVQYEKIAILETPPSESELRAMLQHVGGDLRRLFNTSGQVYRELNQKIALGEKLKECSKPGANPSLRNELLRLLASNGRLVKRPFAIRAGSPGNGVVGFREDEWKAVLR